MPLMERPKVKIENIDGKTLAKDMSEIAQRLNIDLAKANKDKTAKILKRVSSLSDEIVKTRNLE